MINRQSQQTVMHSGDIVDARSLPLYQGLAQKGLLGMAKLSLFSLTRNFFKTGTLRVLTLVK
jgi:hypothetical protein